MNRRTVLTSLPALWLALAVAAAAPAADDLLKLIPDTSLGFVLVNHLTETNGKIQRVGRQMQLPAPDFLAMLKAKAAVTQGFDEKGTAAVAVLPGAEEDSPPVVILYVPVTDYRKFIDQLHPKDPAAAISTVKLWDATFLARNLGSYAVFAEAKDRGALEKLSGSGKGVAEEFGSWQAWFAEQDGVGVLTHAGIKVVAAQLKKSVEQFKEMMGQMDQADNPMGPALAVMDIYLRMFAVAEREVQAAALGVHLDKPGNLLLTKRAAWIPNGQAAKLAAELASTKTVALEGLPAGPFAIAASFAMPPAAMTAMLDAWVGLMKTSVGKVYHLGKDDVDKFIAISRKSYAKVQEMSFVLGVGKGDASLFSESLGTFRVENAKAYLDNQTKNMDELKPIIAKAAGTMPFSEVKKIEIDGKPALEVTMDLGKAIRQSGGGVPPVFFEKIVGAGGKMVAYMVAANPHTILFGYVDKHAVRRGLKVLEKSEPGLAADREVAKTAALLPAGAPWIVYISPSGFIGLVTTTLSNMGAPGAVPPIPAFPKTPPVGCAMTLSAANAEFQIVVPAELLKGIGDYVAKVKGM